MIDVLETFVLGKYGDPARCEDAVVTTAHHVAVLDGATTAAGLQIDGRAPGRLAMEVLREAITRLDPDIDATDAVAELTGSLARVLTDNGVAPGQWASACVLIASARRREIWRVGNSTFVVGTSVHPQHWRLAELPAGMRAAYLRALLRGGLTTVSELRSSDPSLELIAPLLRAEHVFRNDPDAGDLAYTAIDGLPIPPVFIERVSMPADVDIVFCSDGYPVASGTLAAAEDYLHASLAEDPLRIHRHPEVRGVTEGMESYDDRAYLRFRLRK
jgi:hypothetical protein